MGQDVGALSDWQWWSQAWAWHSNGLDGTPTWVSVMAPRDNPVRKSRESCNPLRGRDRLTRRVGPPVVPRALETGKTPCTRRVSSGCKGGGGSRCMCARRVRYHGYHGTRQWRCRWWWQWRWVAAVAEWRRWRKAIRWACVGMLTEV